MKWKHLFQPHILSRGLDYYSNNQVAIEEISEVQIVATVEGSDFYDVSIELTGEKISRMYCDCPYAEDGSNCKHMAAVLYAADQEYEALLKSPADNVASLWKTTYPCRTALREELKKVGLWYTITIEDHQLNWHYTNRTVDL